jgi:DNA-binding transcriptional LysR family regulator
VFEDIRSGTADIGITYVDNLPDFIEAKRLGRETFDVVLPRTHPLTKAGKRTSVALADLASFPFVSFPSDARTRRIIDGAASTAGVAIQHVVTVTQFATMTSLVRAGVGIAIVPSSAIRGVLGTGLAVLKLGKPRLTRDIGLISLRDRELRPAAKGFAATLESGWPR